MAWDEVQFADCYQSWKTENEKKLKPLTFKRYSNIAEKHLIPFFADARIEDITEEKVTQFIQLKEGERLSLPSIKMCILMLKKVSKKIPQVSIGMENSRNAKKAETEGRKTEILTLTQKEEKILLEAIGEGTAPLGLAVLLSLKMGLLLGEICGVRWSDVDMNAGTIHVRNMVQRVLNQEKDQEEKTKLVLVPVKENGEDRLVPIPDAVMEALRRADSESEFLCGKRDGKLPDPRTMQWRLKKLCAEVGMENRNFHDLRNSFAVKCVRSGMRVEDLSRVLGHGKIATTAESYYGMMERRIGGMEDVKRLME